MERGLAVRAPPSGDRQGCTTPRLWVTAPLEPPPRDGRRHSGVDAIQRLIRVGAGWLCRVANAVCHLMTSQGHVQVGALSFRLGELQVASTRATSVSNRCFLQKMANVRPRLFGNEAIFCQKWARRRHPHTHASGPAKTRAEAQGKRLE
uniref:Uncharacterized protein n=1 Tax=Eutreptiella gymnastica TaxID=73025 RepID=A0A7S4CZ78_9EUGL